eukprot:5093495-Pleurochrysis_carterae.AAC.1
MLPCAGFWRLQCHDQVQSPSLRCRLEARRRESAVFHGNETAVDFLKAVIDCDVETAIIHTVKLSKACYGGLTPP